MDAYAKKGVDATSIPDARETYSSTWMGFYTEDGIMLGDVRGYLQNKYLGKRLKDYLQDKYGWDNTEFWSIDWDSIEKVISGYKPCYRIRIAQLMHDWQYTGERKELMGDNDSKCPFGCEEQET